MTELHRSRRPMIVLIGILVLGSPVSPGPGHEEPPRRAFLAGAPRSLAEATERPVAQSTGRISGRVRFSGDAPRPAEIQMAADPNCVAANQGRIVTVDRLVVNENGTLRWVFVYIRESGSGALPAAPGESVVLLQEGCVYRPHVVGIQAGATLRIVNADPTLHNVNIQPENNPGFNVAQPIPGMATERSFANPEVMIMARCDVHPWMQAFIGVVPHAFFDVTGEKGAFSIESVPPGEYVVEAWHETEGTRTVDITVRAGATTSVEFSFGSG